MKKIYSLLFLLSIAPVVLKAQSNFKPGYIVNLKGDTLKGSVDYREWDNNPATITFKGADGTGTNYSAETVKAFAVNGFVSFVSAMLPISQQQVDINLTSNKNADTAVIVKTVFLRALTTGKILSLYAYTDQIKSRFYITEGPNKPMQELIYQVYYDENSALKKITRYKLQLQYIANQNGATSVSGQITAANYTKTDLVKIAQAINGNTTDAATMEADTKGTRTFVGVGVNYSTLTFAGSVGPFPGGAKQNSVSPTINAGIDLYFDKNTQTILFRTELSLSSNHYNFPKFALSGGTPSGGMASLDLKQNTLAITPQFVFNISNTANFKLFVDAGLALNLSLYNDYKYHIEYTGFPSADTKFPSFRGFWVAVPAKIGCVINNKIEIGLGYSMGQSLNDENGFTSKVTSFGASVNFLFGK